MIAINRKPADTAALLSEYPENSVERDIIRALETSERMYSYPSKSSLQFELKLRREIINAANALYRSRLTFKTFHDSTCNTDYWVRTADGGFALKAGVKPADAVRDIYQNSSKYGTECATAMLMVYYKALLEVFPEKAFNEIFRNIYLMNWHRIEAELREVGLMKKANDYLPGDRRYFKNPDVDSATPEWQGENVIDLGGGLYYGHGIGKHRADTIIKILNQNRKGDADESAFLLSSVARPDFSRLAALYDEYASAAFSYSA